MEPHLCQSESFGKGWRKAFDNVSEAVKGAQVIHLTLKDDATVDEVLEKASAGFSPGVTIYGHTTTSVEGTQKRAREWKAKGITYLHAPVFMGLSNALESTGFMLIYGDPEVLKRAKPELSKMTGKLLGRGTEAGKATGMKLAGNLFLLTLTTLKWKYQQELNKINSPFSISFC